MENRVVRRACSLAVFCLITLFAAGLILFTKDVSEAAAGAISLCIKVVVPSLFPFFVLSSLCISCGMADDLSRLFAIPMRVLFRLPGSCSPAFIMGLIGGYPVGARTAFDLYDDGACTSSQCARLLTFCSSSGPAFIFSAVGMGLFGSLRVGAVIYVCHVLAAVIIGFVSGVFSKDPKGADIKPRRTAPKSLTASAFTSAVTSSFSAMLGVCGFVIFFSALMAFLNSCHFFSLASKLLYFIPTELSGTLMKGFIEMTSGVMATPSSGLTPAAAMAVCAFIIGWGGLSVHCQVLSLLGDRPISMSGYFKGKLAQGALSAMMTYGAAVYFLRDAAVCAPLYADGYYVTSPMYFIFIIGIYLAVALLLTAAMNYVDSREKKGVVKKGKE